VRLRAGRTSNPEAIMEAKGEDIHKKRCLVGEQGIGHIIHWGIICEVPEEGSLSDENRHHMTYLTRLERRRKSKKMGLYKGFEEGRGGG